MSRRALGAALGASPSETASSADLGGSSFTEDQALQLHPIPLHGFSIIHVRLSFDSCRAQHS
jgi:hypothetical protein